MNELIKEYFYDGIRRIIPGAVVIALYFHACVNPAFGVSGTSSVVVWLCLLGLAWGIGVAVENLSFAPFVILKVVCEWCKKCEWLPWWSREWPLTMRCLCWLLRDETKSVPTSKDEARWRLYQKISAEKVMYRSLGFIALVTVFWPPALPATLVQAKVEWKCWYGLIGAGLAGLFWLCARINEPKRSQDLGGSAPTESLNS